MLIDVTQPCHRADSKSTNYIGGVECTITFVMKCQIYLDSYTFSFSRDTQISKKLMTLWSLSLAFSPIILHLSDFES